MTPVVSSTVAPWSRERHDRSDGTVKIDLPFRSLLQMTLPSYEPEVCPLCRQGIGIVKPGSRPNVAKPQE